MTEVKDAIARGVPAGKAIRAALMARGLDVKRLAKKHKIPRPTMNDVVNGHRRPSDHQLEALVHELGGTKEEWAEVLWLAGKPTHIAKAS